LSEAILIEKLSFRYASSCRQVLSDISLTILEGETLLLLGPSGCGKSTLALTLNGLIPHLIEGELEGRVIVFGQDTRLSTVGQLATRAGIVFQDPESQFCTLTVEEEVAFGLENLCTPPFEIRERILKALGTVGLQEMLHTRVDRLSGGQKQKLALASVLVMEPCLLICDEPTANLDPLGAREFYEVLARLKDTGRFTILLIEHHLNECIGLVDRAAVMSPEGTIQAAGPPREIFSRHLRDLEAFGVWMPPVTGLAHSLWEDGLAFDRLPLTVPEAAESLLPLISDIRPGQDALQPEAASPSSSEAAISIAGVHFAYPNGKTVLDGIDLVVPAGDFVALVGPNGSGKTTLALHLIGMLAPQSGAVHLFGRPVASMTPEELVGTVGYVFQNPEHQFVADTVHSELAYSLRMSPLSQDQKEQRIAEMLREFGLQALQEYHPYKLSQGQKRRLSVATMLISGQKLLILDEPTFGQDRTSAGALMERMRLLNEQGTTLLMITHDMSLVAQYARSVAVLKAGQLLYHGSPLKLFENEPLMQETRLLPPPLWELSQQLRRHNPFFPLIATLEGFRRALGLPTIPTS